MMYVEGQTVWCSTHALTKGIVRTRIARIAGGGWVALEHKPHGIFKLDWEVHATEGAAKARAEVMRQTRVKSLRKQLEKLQNVVF